MRPNRHTLIAGRHNYEVIWDRMLADGSIPMPGPGMIAFCGIKHDDWCSIFNNGLCDCAPEIDAGEPINPEDLSALPEP